MFFLVGSSQIFNQACPSSAGRTWRGRIGDFGIGQCLFSPGEFQKSYDSRLMKGLFHQWSFLVFKGVLGKFLMFAMLVLDALWVGNCSQIFGPSGERNGLPPWFLDRMWRGDFPDFHVKLFEKVTGNYFRGPLCQVVFLLFAHVHLMWFCWT